MCLAPLFSTGDAIACESVIRDAMHVEVGRFVLCACCRSAPIVILEDKCRAGTCAGHPTSSWEPTSRATSHCSGSRLSCFVRPLAVQWGLGPVTVAIADQWQVEME